MTRRRNQQDVDRLQAEFHLALDDLRNDYYAATNDRFRPQPTGISSMGSGADYHVRNETQFLRMIERSRFMDRNNMVVGQAVNRLISNVIQNGFSLDVQTGRKTVDRELARRWQEWANDAELCDYEGEKCFTQFEQLALRHTIVDGDAIVLPLRDFGSMQFVEAHRLRTPRNTKRNVVNGVLMDDSGRRLEYWITKEDLNPNRVLIKVSDAVPIPARDETGQKQVLHVYNPERYSQRRGITAFAPVVDAIGMHDDLQFANLVKAQVASCFTIFEEVDVAVTRPGTSPQTGPQTTETVSDGTTRTLEGLAPGLRVRGAPGVKLQGFSPNIPSQEFFPHAKLILTFIAINLDLPVAVLLLDPSETNFSGWRGAIDQARQRFRQWQQWMIKAFHAPVYRWKVSQWAEQSDELGRALRRLGPERFFAHRWNPPAWRYIEPLKDAQADALRLEKHLTSPRRVAAEQGIDYEELVVEMARDRGLLYEAFADEVDRINKVRGTSLTVADLMGVQVTPSAPVEDEEVANAAS